MNLSFVVLQLHEFTQRQLTWIGFSRLSPASGSVAGFRRRRSWRCKSQASHLKGLVMVQGIAGYSTCQFTFWRNICKKKYIYIYEACCLFIVKAVCFGQIRASPIVFQVRYVLGGWCYIMVPLSIFPWFPGWFLQVHLTWTPMYMRHPQNSFQGVSFSDEFALGGIPTWKRVTITSPVAFQVFLPAINKA